MADTNLNVATRDAWVRSVKDQVIIRLPLLNRLLARRRVRWSGGLSIKRPVDMAEFTDSPSLAQSYTANEALTAGTKEVLKAPKFLWKYFQVPIQYGIEEQLQNAGGSENQIVELVEHLVGKAGRGARLHLNQMMYSAQSSTSDSDAQFQGLLDALFADTTYGTIARATTVTNQWWQGASIAGSFADNATARTPSISNFRKAKTVVWANADARNPGELLAITSDTIFMALQAEAETFHIYNRKDSELANQGFNAMILDGVEVVSDPFLESDSTRRKYFFMLHLPDWELRLHPMRSFKMTPFTWQGDQPNGKDEWLGRVMVAGNLVCWKPNASIANTNWS